MKNLNGIPRILNRKNIDQTIDTYLKEINKIPLTINATTVFELLRKLKRDKIGTGPYPNVSIFESSNRIMTDLILLYGIKLLLNGVIPEIQFEEYLVEFGNENNNEHDVTASNELFNLKCEVFNTAASFFQTKKNRSLKKLRKNKKDNDILLIIYNKDAVPEKYEAKHREKEYSLAVNIEEKRFLTTAST